MRHIIVLMLWRYVFSPFTFGLTDDQSTLLRTVEAYTIQNGSAPNARKLILEPQFSNALLVRQRLGRGALHASQSNQGLAKKELVKKLVDTLTLLLPKSGNQTSIDGLHKRIDGLVGRAVDVANEMCEEEAIFQCFVDDLGLETSGAVVDLNSSIQGAKVEFCTFLGLKSKISKAEDRIVFKESAD